LDIGFLPATPPSPSTLSGSQRIPKVIATLMLKAGT
jgi:hypothetical protein